MICSHCEKTLDNVQGAAFCPFCGGALKGAPQIQESQEAAKQAEEARAQRDPVKRYKLLQEAEKTYPESLAVAEELLFLGRLHQRSSKEFDLSVIKSYLLMLYLKPEEIAAKRQAELRQELFDHPQLARCLALADDQEAFLRRYLTRLSKEFIDLFLRGDSRYMRRIFGFGLDSQAPKYLADPTAAMLRSISRDMELTGEQRDMLMGALYQAFKEELRETSWLNERLDALGIAISR